MPPVSAPLTGTLIAAYGKRYDVETPQGETISCVTRGKKGELACGDHVVFARTSANEGVIEQCLPRKSLLYRSDAYRTKLLAANVSQIIIVLAASPSFYEALLNRCLIAAENAGISALILLNKADLPQTADAMAQLAPYQALGYPVVSLSAINSAEALRPWLQDRVSVLVGQSGMGKSTLINALIPHAALRTQAISTVLDSGKHTTTSATLYHLDPTSDLIDSPGLQEFGLNHLSIEALEMALPEFRPHLGRCRFNDCHHTHEPDCAILAAAARGEIHPTRLEVYQKLLAEIQRKPA